MFEKLSEQNLQETKLGKESSKSASSTITKPLSSSTAGGPSSPVVGFRSRTDSVIEYAPPMVGETAGSTFYITKAGHIDYIVLLKVKITYA